MKMTYDPQKKQPKTLQTIQMKEIKRFLEGELCGLKSGFNRMTMMKY